MLLRHKLTTDGARNAVKKYDSAELAIAGLCLARTTDDALEHTGTRRPSEETVSKPGQPIPIKLERFAKEDKVDSGSDATIRES